MAGGTKTQKSMGNCEVSFGFLFCVGICCVLFCFCYGLFCVVCLIVCLIVCLFGCLFARLFVWLVGCFFVCLSQLL